MAHILMLAVVFVSTLVVPFFMLCIMAFNRGLPSVVIGPIAVWSLMFSVAVSLIGGILLSSHETPAVVVPIGLFLLWLLYALWDVIKVFRNPNGQNP